MVKFEISYFEISDFFFGICHRMAYSIYIYIYIYIFFWLRGIYILN